MTQIVVDIEAAAEAIYEAGRGERWYPNPGDTWATLPDGPLAQKIRHEARRVVEAALPERCWCGGTLLDSAGGEGLACERDSSHRPTEQG